MALRLAQLKHTVQIMGRVTSMTAILVSLASTM